MNTTEILTSLTAAKEAHLPWLDYGMAILNGEDLLYVQAPVTCTDCNFGLWFYTEANSLRQIDGFQQIEKLHAEFHNKYDILFTHAHEAHKPRLFGKKKLLLQLNADYMELEESSILLIDKLKEVREALQAKEKLSQINREAV